MIFTQKQTMGNTQPKLMVISEKPQEEETVEEECSTFTCEICIESMPSIKKFKNNDRCVHPFCLDCLAKYIQVKVEDNIANVKCPGLNCEQLLDPLTCQPIISVELFNKWCDCLCDSAVLEFERCYCPYQNCSALVINECEGTVMRSKCPNCKKLFCYKCKVPWHAGYWCTETRRRRDANDVKFGELVEKNKWTRCPLCGQSIERLDGCRNVKCRCGNHFCHKCGEKMHLGKCQDPYGCCRSCCYCCILPLLLALVIFLPMYFALR